MTYTKEQIQQRVLLEGKHLALDKFSWDKTTNTFSSNVDNLVLDFNDCNNINFILSAYCTITTGYHCTIKTGSYCTIKTGDDCIITTRDFCTITTMWNCTITTWWNCTITTRNFCTITTGSGCTITTDSGCTITTMWNCTIKTGVECAIIRSDIFEIIKTEANAIYQICPYRLKGHLKNGIYSETGKECIIIDNILSEIISQKGKIYKVMNYNIETQSFDKKITYIVKDGDISSHGDSIKEAKKSLIYKISNRDTSIYNNYTPDTILTKTEAIKMYRVITGSCESETRRFVEGVNIDKEQFTIKEIIDITNGQYGNDVLKRFFKLN